MRKLTSICFLALLLLIGFNGRAGGVKGDTIKNNRLLPDHYKMQFAGSIGFLSLGVGYSFFHEKLELDLLIGHLPKSIGGVGITSITLKQNYRPFIIHWKRLKIRPISLGIYESYSLGDQFFLTSRLSDKYTSGYYWWSSAIRLGVYTNQEVEWSLPDKHRINTVSLYSEIGTNDLSLYSYFPNNNRKYLKFTDILKVAVGIKVGF